VIRFLLVDDHEVVRRGLRQLLAEGYPDAEFGEASTLPAAREAMAQEPWQLMLLDINLPGGSGLELLARARQLCPQMAVLMLSAYPEQEFAVRAFKLGASGYLTKASVADEMLLAVRRVLAGGRYVSAALAEHLAATLGNPQAQALHEALSPRELEVMRAVAIGRTIKEIAANLQLSEKTIATYRSRVSDKLGVSTNVELARYALQNGLVD
jgi:two-component system, NarL family, invasion response regulator UvrY